MSCRQVKPFDLLTLTTPLLQGRPCDQVQPFDVCYPCFTFGPIATFPTKSHPLNVLPLPCVGFMIALPLLPHIALWAHGRPDEHIQPFGFVNVITLGVHGPPLTNRPNAFTLLPETTLRTHDNPYNQLQPSDRSLPVLLFRYAHIVYVFWACGYSFDCFWPLLLPDPTLRFIHPLSSFKRTLYK